MTAQEWYQPKPMPPGSARVVAILAEVYRDLEVQLERATGGLHPEFPHARDKLRESFMWAVMGIGNHPQRFDTFRELTDAEIGRNWAEQNGGAEPYKVATGKYTWYDPESHGYPKFHHALSACLDTAKEFYPDENAAYADLWRAVKEVRKEVPDLKMGE